MKINPLHDAESSRQQRNMTNSQRKTNLTMKEGVVVNSFIKDNQELGLADVYNNLIISNEAKMPTKLYEGTKAKDKSFLPIAALSLGVMTTVALFSAFVKRNAKIVTNLAKEKWLPTVTRNVQLSEETSQAVYQMIQNPSRSSIIAGTGVLGLTATAFMSKTFLDGYKDIWIKRKEADIQKNLQEKLIEVETQSFSGKMQIIRGMMSKRAQEFDKYLNNNSEPILQNFGNKKRNQIPFMSNNESTKKENSKISVIGYVLAGVATFAGIVGLGAMAIKNASKSQEYLQKYLNETKDVITNVVKNTTKDTQKADMESLENMFKIVGAKPDYIKTVMQDVKWDEKDVADFTNKVIKKMETSTTKVNENIGGDGTPKPAFNSFVDDYRAFFYNWLLDPSNPQFKQLFLGVTGVTAVGYAGKLVGDAIKDVQVKKINAETELELQQRLVSTELRNFKSKKDSAIQPLVDEFYKQVDNGKSKEELKTMAENILFEIKNGAPFVYS